MYEVKRDRVENELRVREAERKKLGDYVVEDESLLKRCQKLCAQKSSLQVLAAEDDSCEKLLKKIQGLKQPQKRLLDTTSQQFTQQGKYAIEQLLWYLWDNDALFV